MKNVILTHKELQINLFLAVADGVVTGATIPKGYFLSYSVDGPTDFEFRFCKSATKSELGDGKILFTHPVNKGEYQMNDIRPGVTIAYLRDHARKFLKEVDVALAGLPIVSKTQSGVYEMRTQKVTDAEHSYSVFIVEDSDPDNAIISGYGDSYEDALYDFIDKKDAAGYIFDENLNVIKK